MGALGFGPAGLVGLLGGMIALGGAEFRLPILVAVAVAVAVADGEGINQSARAR